MNEVVEAIKHLFPDFKNRFIEPINYGTTRIRFVTADKRIIEVIVSEGKL